MIVSAFFLRRLLGHLDGPRIANSYIRMGYAALGSAVAGVGALWLLGSYSPVGFAWSNRLTALVTIIVVGPVMLAAYLLLLKLFRVTELRDLLRPLLGRLGRGAGRPQHGVRLLPPPRMRRCTPIPPRPGRRSGSTERPTPERATVSVDTGLIPRISGEFDAASFRAGPAPHAGTGEDGGRSGKSTYLPEEESPSTRPRRTHCARRSRLPGRRTFQGKPGQNPYFRRGRNKKK